MRRISSSLSAFMLLGVVVSACGGKDGSQVNGGNGNGATSSGGSIVLGTGGRGNGLGGSGVGTVISPGDACATGTANASLSGVNMFVMFDRSSSMNQKADPKGNTRWRLTSQVTSKSRAKPAIDAPLA